jgi:SAM-dependent methyltransferase
MTHRANPIEVRRRNFEEHAGRMNLMLQHSHQSIFTGIILGEVERRSRKEVLDVGCGRGIGRKLHFTSAIRSCADSLWGIEPDETIPHNPALFNHFQHALLETAELPSGHFDIGYASFVVEHVTDPAAFFSTVSRVLRPGGVFLFITPNASAFFGRVSRMLSRLKLDDATLRLLKGRKAIAEYHYPVVSRCNTVGEVREVCRLTGLAEPEFAFFQFSGVRNYFPGPLRPLYHLLVTKRRISGNPLALDTMIVRVHRP